MSNTKPEPSTDEALAAGPTTIISVDPHCGESGFFRVNSDGDLIIGNRTRAILGGRALVVKPLDFGLPGTGLVINWANDFGGVFIMGVKPCASGRRLRSLMIDTDTGQLCHEP